MVVHGSDTAENADLALHVLNLVVKSLPDQSLVIVLATEDVPVRGNLLQLLVHDVVAQLTFALHCINLLLQRVSFLVVTACALLDFFQLFEKSFLLAFELLMFLLRLSESFFSLHESLLRLLLQLLLELFVLFEDPFFDDRLGELGLVLGLAVQEGHLVQGLVPP